MAKKISKEVRGDYDEELFDSLRAMRQEIADQKNVPLFVVFSNAVLKEFAYFYPREKGLFLAIKGVGDSKYEKYGEKFISLIKDYVEHIGVSSHVLKEREEELRISIKPEKPKVNIKERTEMRKARVRELIGQKMSIDDMAADLDLTPNTIVNYIGRLLKDDSNLDVQYIKDSIEGYNDIVKSFEKHGLEKMSPVYGDLGGNVEFGTIALVRTLIS